LKTLNQFLHACTIFEANQTKAKRKDLICDKKSCSTSKNSDSWYLSIKSFYNKTNKSLFVK